MKILLDIPDATGSRVTVEHDERDGRNYLVVWFDGRDNPFELTPDLATRIAGSLSLVAAFPREVTTLAAHAAANAVKQASQAVKTGKAGS